METPPPYPFQPSLEGPSPGPRPSPDFRDPREALSNLFGVMHDASTGGDGITELPVDLYADPRDMPQPAHIPKPPKAIINTALFAPVDIDTDLDREAIFQENDIPESRPALAGLRKAIIERRIKRKQQELEDGTWISPVMANVAEGVLRGSGYAKFDNPNRPTTRREFRTEKRLDAIVKKRLPLQNHASHVARSVDRTRQTAGESGSSLSRKEKRLIRKNEHHVHEHNEKLLGLDRQFQQTLGIIPEHYARKLVQERDKLVVRSRSLELAQERRKAAKEVTRQRRQQERDAKAARRAARKAPPPDQTTTP